MYSFNCMSLQGILMVRNQIIYFQGIKELRFLFNIFINKKIVSFCVVQRAPCLALKCTYRLNLINNPNNLWSLQTTEYFKLFYKLFLTIYHHYCYAVDDTTASDKHGSKWTHKWGYSTLPVQCHNYITFYSLENRRCLVG